VKRATASLLLCIATLTVMAAAQKQPAKADARAVAARASAAAVDAAAAGRIKADIRFLSHDLLEGRGTGQRGGDIAAQYIATQFALMGLQPAGEHGSYFQKVPLVGVTTVPEESSFTVVPGAGAHMDAPLALRFSQDIAGTDTLLHPVDEVDAPIVFVGYGIEAPEYKWNDYKDADVRGKIVMMFVNEPVSTDDKFFKGRALTYYGRWTYKYDHAASKGAAGVILIHKTDMASYGWDVVRNGRSSEQSFLKEDAATGLKLASWVQLEVARKMLAASGLDLDDMLQRAQSRDFHPIPLPLRLRAKIVSKLRPIESDNVVAMLPGSDLRGKEQGVIYSAHYDHLGIHPGDPGDNIYNGAMDNATGSAILLEMARRFAAMPVAPKRSMYFAAVTAEEQGLLGSEMLGKNLPIPARNMSLNLNFDDLPPRGIPEEVEVSGAERTSAYPMVQAVAKAFGMAIVPDSRPQDGHYYRSDHFSFARTGVPAFSVNQGMKFRGHTLDWGMAQERAYRDQQYHQPSDEFQEEMDFTGDAIMVRFGVELGERVANAPSLVQWEPGDEFEAARKQK
jgi:Zn-dependent M28 family amino/carboxypeptidase